MAANCRLVLSHVVGERSQKIADQLVSNTAKKLRSMPLFVTDGLRLYTAALRKQYGKLQQFAPTGKRGRPRIPKLIVDDLLKYAQVIKMRVNGRLNKVIKRIIFGKNVDPKMISTSYIERQNLTCRQDNNGSSLISVGSQVSLYTNSY